MIRFFKDLYLTLFTLGYKAGFAGGWQRLNHRFGIIMDQGKGVFLVSIMMFFILFGIKQYIGIHIGKRFAFDSLPVELVAVLAIYYVNLYILVTCGHGIKYEREFHTLKNNRKTVLIMSCLVLMFAAIAFTLYGRDTYLHLPRG
jgi:hypothetical protein